MMVFCDKAIDWRSGSPDNLPELTKLSVECGKEEMTIYLEFSAPYDGSIYSKSNGQSSRCIHVAPHSHITDATFSIEYDACGTRSDPQGKFYENTIVIQYDDVVIEAWDEAKKIRCEWHDGYEKSAYKMPITISDLDVVEMNFQGDDVDCWLEVQDGKGPWSAKVEGLVPLGSPLTLVVAIQDSEGYFDMRVKSCIAHDGQKHPIHLTDEDGCVLRPKMMTPFQKTTDTKGTASVIAYSHFYAFKFPETVEVTIQCTVEICRHGCPITCQEGRDSQTSKSSESDSFHPPPMAKENEDVPTYKDSHPFSTVITSRPGLHNESTNLNSTSSIIVSSQINASKEEGSDPLETSPNTNHGFYLNKYPYNLFDDLIAEDRQDDKIDYDNHPPDKEFSEKTDDVYYSQFPDIFQGFSENGKNFPSAEKLHDLSNETTDDANDSARFLNETDEYYLSTVPNLTEDATLTIQMGMQTSTIATEIDLSTTHHSVLTEQKDKEPIMNTTSSEDKDYSNEHNIEERNMHTNLDITTTKSIPNQESKKTGEIFIEPNDYNDALTENKGHDVDMTSTRQLSEENTPIKKSSERNFDDYKAKARKPFDNYGIRQNYQHLDNKPFLSPAPAPPLTLFNGIPLYYYGNQNTNVDLTDRDGPYLSRYAYQKDYVKSKLRRPGRRRGRREIGENEQLGLKQTLRVIAVTDLDFFTKEDEKVKSLYIGKPDPNSDVCIAPSSFAAGLGLLLIANVCVLCVVVFLGHHYYLHRRQKVKTVELLDTESS